MKLRPEYEKIRSHAVHVASLGIGNSYVEAIREAVERCQQLADKPPKMLTDAEIEKAFVPKNHTHGISAQDRDSIRRVIAAYIAKQK